jgi:hypothetical protein
VSSYADVAILDNLQAILDEDNLWGPTCMTFLPSLDPIGHHIREFFDAMANMILQRDVPLHNVDVGWLYAHRSRELQKALVVIVTA